MIQTWERELSSTNYFFGKLLFGAIRPVVRWPVIAGERPPTANSPGRLPGGASGPVSIVFGFVPEKADSRRTVILQDFGI